MKWQEGHDLPSAYAGNARPLQRYSISCPKCAWGSSGGEGFRKDVMTRKCGLKMRVGWPFDPLYVQMTPAIPFQAPSQGAPTRLDLEPISPWLSRSRILRRAMRT